MKTTKFVFLLSLALFFITTIPETTFAREACAKLFKRKMEAKKQDADGDEANKVDPSKNCKNDPAYPADWKSCKDTKDCLLIDGNCASNPVNKTHKGHLTDWLSPCKTKKCTTTTTFKTVSCSKNICVGK